MDSQFNRGLATKDTPLIQNAWYVAGTSDDFTQALNSRWLLGRNVLFYRRIDGTPVALDNRCPHRSFPLSLGKRVGDQVVCGYHGMRFASDGHCTLFPPISRTPGNIRTQAFPVQERGPLVWIWLGQPELANLAAIPEYHDFGDAAWAAVSGYFHVEANYVGLQENLQDLSHFEHLHASSIGDPDRSTASADVHSGAGRIVSTKIYRDILTPPLWQAVLDMESERITRTIDETFHSPALCDALTTIHGKTRAEAEAKDFRVKILHFITPETQHTTHYWWFFARDFMIDNPATDEQFRSGIGSAFMEDKVALESISALTRRDDRTDFRELSFASDKGGILLRRHLFKLAALESQPAG